MGRNTDRLRRAAEYIIAGAGKLQRIMQPSVQESVAKGFQKAMGKTEEKKHSPDVRAVDDTDGKN